MSLTKPLDEIESSRKQSPDKVLVVEDDHKLSDLISEEIREMGKEVRCCGSVDEAKSLLSDWGPDLIVSDLRLPGDDGFELLRSSRQHRPAPQFVMITAFGEVPQAVEALRMGADDFLTKPLDFEHLKISIERCFEKRALQDELHSYRSQQLGDYDFHGLIGRSRASQQLFEEIRSVAKARGPALIVGESGVGKELVARALHKESDRAQAAFVAVNCASIPSELFESEFFGHQAGAFTGAQRDRKGYFEAADGGCLFLDEIGEMAPSVQAKLLRVIEEGRIRAVGENRERSIDVRVIAATNRDLAKEIETGGFREDLYYRLESFQIYIPPLRDRVDDIEALLLHYFRKFAKLHNQRVDEIEQEAFKLLTRYSYPGNVRELKNMVERAVSFSKEGRIGLEQLDERLLNDASQNAPQERSEPSREGRLLPTGQALPSLAELESRYIDLVLQEVGGNKQRAAALLGIGRKTLYRKLK